MDQKWKESLSAMKRLSKLAIASSKFQLDITKLGNQVINEVDNLEDSNTDEECSATFNRYQYLFNQLDNFSTFVWESVNKPFV